MEVRAGARKSALIESEEVKKSTKVVVTEAVTLSILSLASIVLVESKASRMTEITFCLISIGWDTNEPKVAENSSEQMVPRPS